MEISRIRKKYCKDNKVQVMFSNAPNQVILSKEGYLYYRDNETTIHRYLDDPVRNKMPFKNHPASAGHATHLFNYNQIYAKFTRYRSMGYSYGFEDSYSLTFLYFVRAENGEALCAEFGLGDFESSKDINFVYTKKELEHFLYKLQDSDADAKCIFEWFGGMKYVKHRKEMFQLDNTPYLELDDEKIVKKYNIDKRPIYGLIFDSAMREKAKSDTSWMANSIDDIHDFTITNHGALHSHSPMQLVIQGDTMYVYDFEVIFKEKDMFEVKSKRRTIRINHHTLFNNAKNIEYTSEPKFEE